MITNKNILNGIFAFLLISMATSCFNKGFPAEKMLGTWSLQKATRDTKDITLMMGDAYFTFMEGNRLKTNFPSEIPVDEELGYTLQDKNQRKSNNGNATNVRLFKDYKVVKFE